MTATNSNTSPEMVAWRQARHHVIDCKLNLERTGNLSSRSYWTPSEPAYDLAIALDRERQARQLWEESLDNSDHALQDTLDS